MHVRLDGSKDEDCNEWIFRKGKMLHLILNPVCLDEVERLFPMALFKVSNR